MATAVHKDLQAFDRLEALGLTEEIIRRAVTEGQLARASCTANDPPLIHGVLPWGKTTTSLRDQLLPLGWSRKDEKNQPLTISPEKDFAVVAFTGDDATGDPARIPQPKNPKGSTTLMAVEKNRQQLSLFPSLTEPPIEQPNRLTWVLLFARVRNELRCELSLPSSIGEDGVVMGWAERIILPAIQLGDSTASSHIEEEQPVDVEVVRKAK